MTEEAGGQNSESNWNRSRHEKRSVRQQKWEERSKRSANARAHYAGEDEDYEYEYEYDEYEYCDEDPEHSHPVKEGATQLTCPCYLSFF